MAKNRLQERDNDLPNVEYDAVLKEILTVLKKRTDMFQVSNTVLQIEIDNIAQEVTNKLKDAKLADVRPFEPLRGLTHTTANFLDGEALNRFRQLIERIQEQLSSHIKTALASTLPAKTTEQYICELLSSPGLFIPKDKKDAPFALRYPFNAVKLNKRRLHLQARQKPGPGQSDIRLLGHKLTIAVSDMYKFENHLVDALCNQLEMCDPPPTAVQIERTRIVLQQRLQDENSEQGMLKRVMRKEAFGRLQKEAKIRYLEYLAFAISKKKTATDKGLQLLQNLINRLRMLEAFLRTDKPDEFYQVSYGGHGANYRILFSRAEVLDLLPIFSDIEGSLGETFDKGKGEQEFTLGIKLKLNGRFRTYPSAFEYYLKLLDPHSPEHQKRIDSDNPRRLAFIEKVLKLALLYYFVFKRIDDLTYNPAQDVETELLKYLKANDSDKVMAQHKRGCLIWLVKGLSSDQHRTKLHTLKDDLQKFVKSASSDFDLWPTSLFLSVDADLLYIDEDRMKNEKKFFRVEALQEKGIGMLKYITIEEASAAGNSLCSLPVTMTFEPLYYYSAQDTAESFAMKYNIGSFEFLPVIYSPNTPEHLALCQQYYKTSHRHVLIPYAPTLPYNRPALLFIYHFTYLLLTYMCLKLLHDQVRPSLKQNRRLFFPLVRIHETAKTADKEEKYGEEEFLRAYCKTLAHLLCEQGTLANAQGLHIDVLKQPNSDQSKYKLPNALSSLYSVLPKVFTLPVQPQLEQLAIIVVSSRKCDAHKDSALHLSNIYGEVIGIRRYQKDPKNVQVIPLGTFSANETSDNLYRTPTVLQEQAKNCYEGGYKHILYVAQAPYSSFLHLTSAETAEEQFFMSGSIIQSLKQGQSDLHIYPVYCDKFYVVNISGKKVEESLYVDETRELRSLLDDPNRSSVVFFNLLNGKVVNRESVYNGVVSYATLINVYDDPIYDQDIRNHLLDSSQPGSLKKDILAFLMLLHFARYERDQQMISFKLDPYENIIGFDSVGTLSTIDHMEEGIRFNMLAFLTEVRSVLNRRYSGYTSTLLEKTDEKEREDLLDNEQKNGDESEQA